MVTLSGGAAAACLAFLLPSIATAQLGAPVPRTSPNYNHDFEFPLPVIPAKQPLATYINPETGVPVDFYEVKITAFTKNLFPDLGDASLVGYDGLVPGPTFRVARGRETVIRFVNEYYRPSGVHLHGSYSRAAFDGWAEDTILPGQYKDYYYPNKQSARTLWYHDHAVGITAINGYSGQSGFYIIQDDALEASLDLPRGKKYDIPLLLTSRRYTATGNITDETNEQTSTYGDTFSVNGQILPHFTVEPRKYRFRLLNAAVSRTFNLSLVTTKRATTVPFYVVGSDCGFMSKPVQTESLVLSMSERWEIVIDFSEFAGEKLILANTNIFADTNYAGTDKVMQFRVHGSGNITSNVGNGPLPDKLVDLDLPTNKETIDQSFFFNRAIGRPWTINGKVFSDVQNRILRNVPRGTTEKWLLKGAGGWSHPIHIHLIDFQILSREVGNRNQAPGRTQVTPYEAAAIKDVAVLGENEAVTVLAKFAPWDGVYMFHCHNNIHEDHDMMAAFNVSGLSDFGYPETIGFEDPMDPRFRAKPYTGTNIAQIESEVLPFFSKLNAYKDIPKVQAALDHYWAPKKGTRSCKSTTSTGPYYTNTSAPTTSPTNAPRPDGKCGRSAGGATCQPGYCCSKYGYCGTTEQYCSPAKGCQFGCTGSTGTGGTLPYTSGTVPYASGTAATPSTKPSSGPRPDGQCGPSAGGATCQPGYCCSKYGYCGTTEQYCSPAKGCQFGCTGTAGTAGTVPYASGTTATPSAKPSSGPRPDGQCGPSAGGATCQLGYCCSKYGYCGTTDEYCSPAKGCQFGCRGTTGTSATPSSSSSVTPSGPGAIPTSTPTGGPRSDGRCGVSFGGATCVGSPSGPCCSEYGYCGITQAHCLPSNGCQSGCNAAVPSGTGDETVGECGTQHGGKTCTGANCCSKWGWCGVGDDYCGIGCQGGPCTGS